jgi:PleD family two-component response regulator
MTHPATRRVLLDLIGRHGSLPVVVVDVDDCARVLSHAGAEVGRKALADLADLLDKRAARTNGHVHIVEPGRVLVALPGGGYDDAVAFAERSVDAFRALGIPFSAASSGGPGRLSVTAAVVSVESKADIERFDLRVNDLLRDGKSTGGDAIIRDR